MAEEVNYKVKFMDKYYRSKNCDFDIDKVDIVVKNTKGKTLLYIESKNYIYNEQEKRKALAQIILTDKQQKQPLTKVALIYIDKENNDNLIEIDCGDDSVLHNNDINWDKETPSNPTKDAIDRINDRIAGRTVHYKNEEIKEYFKALVTGKSTEINITENNFITIYGEWKNEVKFRETIENEQDFINLFIVDILNGTKYEDEQKDRLINTGFEISGTRIDNYEILKDISSKKFVFCIAEKLLLFGLLPILISIMIFGVNTEDRPKWTSLSEFWNSTANYTANNTEKQREANIHPILLWNFRIRN